MALMVTGIGFAALVTGALAERFVERGREEEAEALEPLSPDDLAAHVDRLTVAARDLAAELDALRVAVSGTEGRGKRFAQRVYDVKYIERHG
jgi:hypothetical protein